jgi:hypothetical protein
MHRKTVEDGIGVKLEVQNDNANADGKSPITAQVTVTENNGIPTKPYTVHFELEGGVKAQFTDDDSQTTTADATPENEGIVSKEFTDKTAETGSVYAYVRLDDEKKPHDQKDFEFVAPNPDAIALQLTGNNAEAGSGSAITATATATEKGNPFTGGGTIYFQLVPGDVNAVFANGTKQTTGTLNTTTGKASATFTSPLWEEGTCEAWWKLDDEDKPHDEKDYTFRAPKFEITFNPAKTLSDGTNETVECAEAPAAQYVDINHQAGFTATAVFTNTRTDTAWTNGGMAPFQFIGTSNVQLAPGQDGVDKDPISSNKWWVPIGTTGQQAGQASLSFYDITLEAVDLLAIAPNLGRTDNADTAHCPVQFRNPWHGVSEVDIQYDGLYSSAWIYGNGTQQAKLYVTLTLVDKNNQPLLDAVMPSADDVSKVVKLLNYQTGDELGTGSSSMWSYSQTENEYAHETPLQRASRVPHGLAPGNNGKIQLTYYVTCNKGSSDIAFGLNVVPTGGEVSKTSQVDPNTGIAIGQYTSPSPAITFSQQHIQIATTASLSARTPPIYDVSSLTITGTHQPHGDEKDDGPSGGNSGPDKDGNFWRQWDYTITFSNAMQSQWGTQLFKCILASDDDYTTLTDETNKYCFAQKVNDYWYTYNGYLWPVNLQKADGTALVTKNGGSTIMSASAAQDQTYQFPNLSTPPVIHVTLYMSFAGRPTTANSNNPVKVNLYDQFGNYQTYTFSQTGLPQTYDISDTGVLAKWQPVQVSTGRVEKSWRSEASKPPAQKDGPALVRGQHGVPYRSLGKIYLYNEKWGNPYRVGPVNQPEKGWDEADVDTGPTEWSVLSQCVFSDDNTWKYASTARLFLSVKSADPGGGGGGWLSIYNGKYDIPSLIGFCYSRELSRLSVCRLTPIWAIQRAALYFEATQDYTIADSDWNDPGHDMGSGIYTRHSPFSPNNPLCQWKPVTISLPSE